MRPLPRPRTWMSALALLGLALPAAAAPPPPPSPVPDKYLLDDTDSLVVVNVKQIVASPFFAKQFRKQVESLLKKDEVQAWLRGTGFDPLRDVDTVTAVMGRSSHQSKIDMEPTGPLFLVRGRFEPAKLRAKLQRMAQELPKTIGEHATPGGNLFEIRFGPHEIMFLAILDRNTIVAAPIRDQVADALAKAAGKKKTVLKHKALPGLIKELKPDTSLQAVALGDTILGVAAVKTSGKGGERELKFEYATLAEVVGLTRVVARMQVDADVKGRAELTAVDAGQAKKLSRAIEDGLQKIIQDLKPLGKGGSMILDLKELVKILEGIKVGVRGQTVTLTAEVRAEPAASGLRTLFGQFLLSRPPAAPPPPAADRRP